MKVSESFLLRPSEKKFVVPFLCSIGFHESSLYSVRRKYQIKLLIQSKLSFPYIVQIFSLMCQSVHFVEKLQFKMLVVFPSIFVVNTKIIFGYNFGDFSEFQNVDTSKSP